MASSSSTQPQDVSPEFNQRCLEVLREWESGKLPFETAVETFKRLKREDCAGSCMANEARVEFLLGYMQGYRSNLNVSIRHFEQARDLYELLGNESRLMSCDLNLGESYRQKGDFTRARRLFHAAYEKAIHLGDLRAQAVARSNEGLMLISMGHFRSARTALQEAQQLSDQWPAEHKNTLPGLLAEICHGMAIIHLNENDLQGAWERARQALKLAREIKEPLVLGLASRTVGEVLTALETPPANDEADFSTNPDDYFKASVESFEELESEGEVARTMLVHARSLAKRGRRVPAARQLQAATLIFAKLGMVDDAAKAAESQAEIF